MATERSRAYPLLALEESRLAIGEILRGLGSGCFGREVLGEALGHSNAYGGPGARKIAALTQFGFLSRRAGLYSPTALAERALASPATPEGQAALRQALRRPPLFRALLDRYEVQGRIPAQLAPILWREHGITRKASELAAENFKKSARYAGKVDSRGIFCPEAAAPIERRRGSGMDLPLPIGSAPGSGPSEQRFVFALTEGKIASLSLPVTLCEADLEIVNQQIRLIEQRVVREVNRHG